MIWKLRYVYAAVTDIPELVLNQSTEELVPIQLWQHGTQGWLENMPKKLSKYLSGQAGLNSVAGLLLVSKLVNLKLAQLCLCGIAVPSLVTIAQTYPPVNSVTQPSLLADNSPAVLGAVWVVSTLQSPGKAFAGIQNLTVPHKMCFYCTGSSLIEQWLSSCSHLAHEQPISQRACLHNWDLLVCWKEGQGSGELPGSTALLLRCGQEETTGRAQAELVLRCMGPRAEADA